MDAVCIPGIGTCAATPVIGCCSSAADCDDGNPCSADACSPAGSCLHADVPGPCCTNSAACDDGQACSLDICDANQCTHLPLVDCCSSDAQCDDGAPCTVDRCNDLGACVHIGSSDCCVDDAACADADPCTRESCVAGSCEVAVVDACCLSDADCAGPDDCTVGLCLANTCVAAPLPDCCASAADCLDGDPCTDDVCLPGGVCAWAPSPQCCQSDAECSDGDPCTFDRCLAGSCFQDVAPNCCVGPDQCPDGDPCTEDFCLPDGTCAWAPSGLCCASDAECPDADPCTLDRCVGVTCVHTPDPACCQLDSDCNDGDPCTYDQCDKATETCTSVPIDGECCVTDADCVDGDPCTYDLCTVFGCDHPATPPNPFVDEVCGDGVDNDCDPLTMCYELLAGNGVYPLEPFEGPQGVVAFYGYTWPDQASANTGLETSNRLTVLLYRDPAGVLSLLMIADRAQDGSGGLVDLSWSGAIGAQVLVYDDTLGAGNDIWNVNDVTGSGSVRWEWGACCTDGVALGPLVGDICIDVGLQVFSGLNGMVVWEGPGQGTNLPLQAGFSICADL